MRKGHKDMPWVSTRDGDEGGILYLYWYDKDAKRTKRISLRTTDSVIAQHRYVAYLKEGLAGPKPESDTGLTVSEALDAYFREHVMMNCTDYKRQQNSINHLKAYFGEDPVRELSARKSRTYAEARRSGLVCGSKRKRNGGAATDATIRRELNCLNAAIQHAVKEKVLPPADAPVLDLPKEAKIEGEETLWFTKEEIAVLLATADPDLRDFIILAYWTAARRKSIERLTVQQVKLSQNRVFLLPPGEKQTTKRRPVVPIFPDMREVLERRIAGRTSGYLFDPPIDFYKPFRTLCEALGFENKYNPHMLRHSRATHLLHDGKPIFAVAKLLGDTVATVERVYGHSHNEFLEDLQ